MPKTQRHITAGPTACAAIARLLGLKADGGWRVQGVCAVDRDNVRVSLRGGEHRLVFFVKQKSALCPEGQAGPAEIRFLKAAAGRLGRRSVGDLVRIIESDPCSFAEDIEPGQEGDKIKVPCIGQPMGLLEAGWRNFFADQDFEVLLGVPECSPKGTVTIQYADLECYYARPRRSFHKWNFLDWPEVGMDETPRMDNGGESLIVAELEERDMILGTGERADALVAEARRMASDGQYLIFTHLCTPIVMGEDFQGLARRCQREVGGPTVSWSQKDRDGNDNFGAHLRALLGRPGFFAGRPAPATVNLFHFPMAYRDEELLPLLREFGIKTNICVFPDIEFPALEDLPKAYWQVFCERSSYPSPAKELLAASPRPVLTVPAPYGLRRTQECLKAIAAAAGRQSAFAAVWRKRMADFMPRWEKLREQAKGCRLAFVVSESTLPRLMNLRYGHGAPLAAMALELGFGIDLVYYDLHGEPPQLPEGLQGARVTVFRTPAELDRALQEGDFQAVYSDIFFDWRISRAGKARFSSKDFEMGLAGAERTLRRLLAACRLPFYRRYGAHLGRP